MATIHRTRPEHSSPRSGKKNIASEHNPPSIPLIFRRQGCPTLQHTGIRAATHSWKNFKQIVDGAETAPGNIKYWKAILFIYLKLACSTNCIVRSMELGNTS